jgi:methyltransferase (TIGR00027 family)
VTAKSPIKNISDTAKWVAVYRAWETDRPDAVFRDPYARRLAGEDWMKATLEMPGGKSNAWPMIVRTKVIDELIEKAVGKLGCDLVLNLAAGLDARPYRLNLPMDLTWIEVDLPGMIDHKESRLADEKPRCRLERVKLDLSDRAARRGLFASVAARSSNVLVVTEGLVIYLAEERVRELASDLAAQASFRWWSVDYASPMLLKMLEKKWGKMLEEGNSKFKFSVADARPFFDGLGWRMNEERFPAEDAARLKREMPFAWVFKLMKVFMPAKTREKYRRMAGYALLERK